MWENREPGLWVILELGLEEDALVGGRREDMLELGRVDALVDGLRSEALDLGLIDALVDGRSGIKGVCTDEEDGGRKDALECGRLGCASLEREGFITTV